MKVFVTRRVWWLVLFFAVGHMLGSFPKRNDYICGSGPSTVALRKATSDGPTSVGVTWEGEFRNVSDSATQKKLEFVHITKTGGSAIETAAAQAGVIWGACHFRKWDHLGCAPPDLPGKLLDHGPPDNGPPGSNKRYWGEPWHAPHYWLNPPAYEGSSTFAVIRNPYDRMVSEFHWFEEMGTVSFQEARQINEWIIQKLEDCQQKQHFYSHFLPQHYYVYDANGQRMIDHVLRYENLSQEFPKLVQRFNLPIVLPDKRLHKRDSANMYFTKEHLSDKAINLINTFYEKDFKLLGYEMISSMGDNRLTSKPCRLDEKTTLPSQSDHLIPNQIFMFWNTGWSDAPWHAQLARQSWEILNPSFKVIALNGTEAESLSNRVSYVPDSIWNKMHIQGKSDIYRTLLLHKFGGIWADASLVAARPVREWLDLSSSDLVSFVRTDNPEESAKLTISPWITSWFLAAPKESYTMSRILSVISNSSEFYRFTKEYFYWHRIVSEIANKDDRVRQQMWFFRSADPMHCKTGRFELDAPVFKRCANKQMAIILEFTWQCCHYEPAHANHGENPNISALCPSWNCQDLGLNFRFLSYIENIYGDNITTIAEYQYKDMHE